MRTSKEQDQTSKMLYIRALLHVEDAKPNQIILATRIYNKIESWMVLDLGTTHLFSSF